MVFLSLWISCKETCGGSDPKTDTVKIDPRLFGVDPDFSIEASVAQQDLEVLKNAQEEVARANEEALKREQKEAEEFQQKEDLFQQARRRREEEKARCLLEEQAATERARTAEEALAAAGDRGLAPDAEAQRLEKLAAEAAEARERVNSWCKRNSFGGGMSSKKQTFMPLGVSKYPLHEAVAKNDKEMVELMVKLKVDRGAKNSKGQTPEDVARQNNTNGSMDNILAILQSPE